MTHAPRVGFCGLVGGGNPGNDGSLEVMLAYLRAEHPDAIVDCMSTRPGEVTARYGISAVHLRWYRKDHEPVPLVKCVKVSLAMIVDAFRTASWVRRHDVVIVPGMGVLEATLPLRPWHTPYSVFLLCASGRLFGTRVALVCIGANDIRQRLTRRVVIAAARLAYYRSYRDTLARDAMRRMGFDTSREPGDVQATLRFANGASGTIAYLTGGSVRYPKETMDATGGGRNARLDNFRSAAVWTGRGTRTAKARGGQDKGQRAELEEFVEAVRTGASMPIGIDSLLATTRATIAVGESLLSGRAERVLR